MLPFYFGAGDRRLYGVYEGPARISSARGVVICTAVGPEYFNAHRACRLLARQLAGAGVHAMRFDYLGTGDSVGELEGLHVADWVQDVKTAVTELLDLSGLRKVDLVGLRAGAALAAQAAKEFNRIGKVCLWDPEPLVADSSDELDGTGIPENLLAELKESVRFEDHELPRGSIMIGTGNRPEAHKPLADRLADSSEDFEFTFHAEHGAWESAGDDFGSLPTATLSFQTIVEWSGGGSRQ